jgi:hypothetical protein
MGAALVAGGAAVVGGMQGMRSSEYAAKTAENAAKYNAAVADIAAVDAEQQGALEASRVRSRGAVEMSKARATMIAQGLDPASSGLYDLIEGMAVSVETDAEMVRNNAARQAWGLRAQMTTSIYEGDQAANNLRTQGKAALLSGLATAAGYAASYAGSRSGGTGARTTGGSSGLLTDD